MTEDIRFIGLYGKLDHLLKVSQGEGAKVPSDIIAARAIILLDQQPALREFLGEITGLTDTTFDVITRNPLLVGAGIIFELLKHQPTKVEIHELRMNDRIQEIDKRGMPFLQEIAAMSQQSSPRSRFTFNLGFVFDEYLRSSYRQNKQARELFMFGATVAAYTLQDSFLATRAISKRRSSVRASA